MRLPLVNMIPTEGLVGKETTYPLDLGILIWEGRGVYLHIVLD
jgi:hypothetical protein